MKKLLLLISFIILHLFSFTQTDIQRDTRVNPALKSALSPKSGYAIYGRDNSNRFINIAVLNQSSHTMTWFTCHGRLFDSTRLTDLEYEQVTSKQLDPFVLYHSICNEYLTDIAVAKDIFRLNGDTKIVDSLNSNYQALFASENVQRAKTPLQKLIAIENTRKRILTQLAYLNSADPFSLQDNPLFKINIEQAGAMIQTKDSTVYYNIDPTSAVTKISLCKNSPEKLYIYNRLAEVIDSVFVLPAKYNLLLKEKTDVFLLYRGWLELQWQGAKNNIMRHTKSIDTSLYRQANIKDEKAIEKELYSQLNAIETKINVLISPEEKVIEQAINDTYKNETSEISIIPLLGIAYSLIEKRGLKEYELTNHLGNVLVTVTDKKLGHSSNDSTVDYYNADVVSVQDYYPFGMLQPGREFNVSGYRYGFNGKENDNEVKGEGNQQDYGMRIYDPRLGRFLSVDPITRQYPNLTPYQYASNRPIDGVDIDGLEWGTFTYKTEKDASGRTQIIVHCESYSNTIFDRIGEPQFWLRPQNAKPGEYGSQGIPFNSYKEMFDAAVKFASGQANFDENYQAFDNERWKNFKVIVATDLATQAMSAAEGYVNAKVQGKANTVEGTPTASTNKTVTAANNGNPGAAQANTAKNKINYENYGSESLDIPPMREQAFSKGRIVIDEKRAQHTFRKAEGHFFEDTPAARQALENVANDSKNLLGNDKYGNSWYSKVTEEGKQIWAQIRNGKIINGGINDTPKQYNSETGLSAASKTSSK